MNIKRYYCWRVGTAFNLEEGSKCGECGCDDHREIPLDMCGAYVSINDKEGLPCTKQPNHGGKHD